MSSAPFAESTAESLAAKLHAAQRQLAGQWLEQLNAILPVGKQEVFPGAQLLDHIPQIIEEIAHYLKAPAEEAIGANTAVMAKAEELGLLRYQQRASVHQLLREYHLLGTLLEEFITCEVAKMGTRADAVGALQALGRVSQAVRVLQQQTIDTFVGKYSETIERQTGQLRGFTRLVSHEIRQPLGVLQLIARMLPSNEPGAGRLVEMLGRNVSRLGDTAGKLERLARLTRASDGDSPTEQEVNFTALCGDVARQLEDMAASRGVTIVVDDDLPCIVTDSGRAELAVVNLMANAIKYSDPDKTDRFVRVRRTPGSRDRRQRHRHPGGQGGRDLRTVRSRALGSRRGARRARPGSRPGDRPRVDGSDERLGDGHLRRAGRRRVYADLADARNATGVSDSNQF